MRMLPDILIMRVLGGNSTQDLPQEPSQEHKRGPSYEATSNRVHRRYKAPRFDSTIDLPFRRIAKKLVSVVSPDLCNKQAQ